MSMHGATLLSVLIACLAPVIIGAIAAAVDVHNAIRDGYHEPPHNTLHL